MKAQTVYNAKNNFSEIQHLQNRKQVQTKCSVEKVFLKGETYQHLFGKKKITFTQNVILLGSSFGRSIRLYAHVKDPSSPCFNTTCLYSR